MRRLGGGENDGHSEDNYLNQQGRAKISSNISNGHSQTSKERQPAVIVHWFAHPGTSYEFILIQFSVNELAFWAIAAWLLVTRT